MTTHSAAEVLTMPEAGEYLIDTSSSSITYTCRHMFGLGKVRAQFRLSSGLLGVGETMAASRAGATIDAASFHSGNERRDRDVRGPGLLNVAAFPHIEFASTELREDGGAIILAGTVAMHRVVAPVEVTVRSWEAPVPGRIHITAEARHLDRFLFGITGSRGLVGRYFNLEFQIIAERTNR